MYWNFWIGGGALVAVALGHWLLLGRQMAVSGRFTSLVNRVRFGGTPEPATSAEDMIAAIQAATRAEFGEDAAEDAAEDATPAKRMPQGMVTHVLFLMSLVAGGSLASLTGGGLQLSSSLRSELFPQTFGNDPATGASVLLVGGMLIGFGTRMAAGCTSGHGLCGVSRFQLGSLAATAAFFGTGIVVSMLFQVLL